MHRVNDAPSIVCIGQEDWDQIWRRNQFLLAGLAREGLSGRILFVERACDLTHALRSGEVIRRDSVQRRKMREALRGPWRSDDAPDLWLLTPWKLFPASVAPLRRMQEALDRIQVRRALARLGMRRAWLWTQNPEAAHFVDTFRDRTIYDATDDWSQLAGPKAWRRRVAAGQERLAREARAVLACSPHLYRKWSAVNPRTRLVLNGVDIEHFRRTLLAGAPSDVAVLARPILGYTGTVHEERIDVDLVCEVAAARPHWQLVFVGPIMLASEARSRVQRLRNVHLLGPRPYTDLPRIMGAFDVCILPHRVTAFTESLNPIKLYEYLATGLPIVATPVATVRDMPALIYLARTAGEFVVQAEAALAERNPERRRERAYRAEQNAWTLRVRDVARAMAELT